MSKTQEIIRVLKKGGVGILPTDTIYGIVGSALDKKTVARIYRLRDRDAKKPMIVLISSLNDLKNFDIRLGAKTKKILSRLWPGKVSVILPCADRKFRYLHRGGKTIAFRWPKKKSLVAILNQTGPLVAPSANPEGLPPALTISEAKAYFGDKVDFYFNAGKLESLPSTLVALENGEIIVKRTGAKKIFASG